MSQTIVVVGADDRIAELAAGLEELSFSTKLITNSAQAADFIDDNPIDAIVCDFSARATTGEGLLQFAQRVRPDAVRVLRTGSPNAHLAIDALGDGLVQQFLLIPWPAAYARRVLVLALDRARALSDSQNLPARSQRAGHSDTGCVLLGGQVAHLLPIREPLEAAGYAVTCCESTAALVTAAAHAPPSVAIVDVDSLGTDDLSAIAALEHGFASLPILACGRRRTPAERIDLYENGFHDFLERPVATGELLFKVALHERSRRRLMDTREASLRAERLQLLTAEASALLAHDLNNGLFAAISDVAYLTSAASLDSEARAACESADRALRRIAGLVDNFVQIARLEDSMLSPKCETTSLPDLLSEVISIHEAEARPKHVRWVVDCPRELRAAFDRSLMERALHNIVGNALRYVNPQGAVRLRASHERRSDRDELVLEIGNTGPDIPEHVALTLFEKFASGGDKHAKTGMGMYFCRLACEAHGGSIALHPVPDYAANLTMRIPYVAS